MHPAQPVDIAAQQVVLDESPILGPINADDLMVIKVHQLGPALGFTEFQVWGALGLDYREGHPQPDTPVG